MHKKACILVDKFKYKNEVYENYFNYIIICLIYDDIDFLRKVILSCVGKQVNKMTEYWEQVIYCGGYLGSIKCVTFILERYGKINNKIIICDNKIKIEDLKDYKKCLILIKMVYIAGSNRKLNIL